MSMGNVIHFGIIWIQNRHGDMGAAYMQRKN